MNLVSLIFTAAILVLAGMPASATVAHREAEQTKPTNASCKTVMKTEFDVLLIGNSFSENNGGPKILEQLLLQTRCFGSVTLKPVIRLGGRLLGFKAEELPPPTEMWDVVILQDNSRAHEWGVINGLKSYSHITEMVTLKSQGKILLIETWPTLQHPETHKDIDTYFSNMYRDTGASVVRVGTRFTTPRSLARKSLYASDGKHPSRLGTTLYMCTLAADLLVAHGLPAMTESPEVCAKSTPSTK